MSLRVRAVGRKGCEAGIFHGSADRKVIERLELEALQAEHLVHGVVKESADAGRAHTCGFGFQVQDLSDQPRFPE